MEREMKMTNAQAAKFQESLYVLSYGALEDLLETETNSEKRKMIERTLTARRICGN
jgi:hypothetical protein